MDRYPRAGRESATTIIAISICFGLSSLLCTSDVASASIHNGLVVGEFVRDNAGILEAGEENSLEAECRKILDLSGAPVLLFTTMSLADPSGPEIPINAYAVALIDGLRMRSDASLQYDWSKLVLVLVAVDDRKVRIELGDGWGHKTYENAGLIRQERLLPYFKKGDYAKGLLEAMESIESLVKGDSLPDKDPFQVPTWFYAILMILTGAAGLVFARQKAWFISKDALHKAARTGRLQDAAKLIKQGAPLTTMDAEGRTPMYHAARAGHFGMVKLLREAGASPNLRDAPLLQAILFKHGAVAKMLLQHGARADIKGPEGNTPLMAAAASGDPDIVKLLLEKKVTVHAKDDKGWSALLKAVESKNQKTIRLLLDAGARVNDVAADGLSPLVRAAMLFEDEIVRMLLAAGADPNHCTHSGTSAFSEAILQDNARILKMLIKAGADISAPIDICVEQDSEMEGGQVGSAGGFTERISPHELAIRHGHKKAASLLRKSLAQKASPSRSLLEAVDNDDIETVKAILKRKPHNVHRRSKDSGWGALHLAVKNRNAPMVAVLLRYGARLNAKNSKGKTPLHQAAELGDMKIVRLLLDAGANPNIQYNRALPFERAAERGHTKTAELLRSSCQNAGKN